MFNNLFGSNYDTAQIAAEYSKRIASIIEFEQLALAAGELLSATLHTSRVAILTFTEDKESIRIDVISGHGRLPTLPLKLPRDAAFFSVLTHATQPILHSVIDPTLNDAQRSWFAKLGLTIYAPIHEGKVAAATLATGARKNKEKYGAREIELLSLIADQTSVALKNASLVMHLRALNAEMRTLNETLLSTNQRLLDMDKVKTDFITITSHELRTPLTQILGFSDLLSIMGDSESVPGKELKDIADSVIKASNRLNDVVTQMLDVSQIDVEALQLSFGDTNMEAILRSALESYAAAIRERKIGFTVVGIRNMPPVSADHKRLAQAFGQVLSNAIKYTPDGGHIDVAFKYLPREGQNAESIEIVFSDSGVGINPKYLESVFEKFFRVGKSEFHSTGTTKFMGAGPGLGLAIAKGIIEGHGGKIWAESTGFDLEKLPGTRIHIVLPLKPPPFAAKSTSAFIGMEMDDKALNFNI